MEAEEIFCRLCRMKVLKIVVKLQAKQVKKFGSILDWMLEKTLIKVKTYVSAAILI